MRIRIAILVFAFTIFSMYSLHADVGYINQNKKLVTLNLKKNVYVSTIENPSLIKSFQILSHLYPHEVFDMGIWSRIQFDLKDSLRDIQKWGTKYYQIYPHCLIPIHESKNKFWIDEEPIPISDSQRIVMGVLMQDSFFYINPNGKWLSNSLCKVDTSDQNTDSFQLSNDSLIQANRPSVRDSISQILCYVYKVEDLFILKIYTNGRATFTSIFDMDKEKNITPSMPLPLVAHSIGIQSYFLFPTGLYVCTPYTRSLQNLLIPAEQHRFRDLLVYDDKIYILDNQNMIILYDINKGNVTGIISFPFEIKSFGIDQDLFYLNSVNEVFVFDRYTLHTIHKMRLSDEIMSPLVPISPRKYTL